MEDNPRSDANTPSELSSAAPSGRKDRQIVKLKTQAIVEPSTSNPFKLPSDNEIFQLRDKERQNRKEERQKQKTMRIEDKGLQRQQLLMNRKAIAAIEAEEAATVEAEIDLELQGGGEPIPSSGPSTGRLAGKQPGALTLKQDPALTLKVTRDRRVEREALSEYIEKKRQMFLVQYAISVKREEMSKLEDIAQSEEKKLELAEKCLEEDAALFDEYLKENDKNSVEAIKAAESETKAKLEKVSEIKKLNAQIVAIKSEISKHEDTLKEYKMYKAFLDKLTPEEWRKDHQKKKPEKASTQEHSTVSIKDHKGAHRSKGPSRQGAGSRASHATSIKPEKTDETASNASAEGEESSDDEEEELYFREPHQLLAIFAELEEQNLSLIQNSQETEEALEEIKQTIKQTQKRMTKETEALKEQIEKLKSSILKEEQKAAELEVKTRMFTYGAVQPEQQEELLSQLNHKVAEVYRNCVSGASGGAPSSAVGGHGGAAGGGGETSLSTLQMLTAIEQRLEELCDQIEGMPRDKVAEAERAKEKERRFKLREEKLLLAKLHQEERIKKALERAKQPVRKQVGRRLVFRSDPPAMKKKEEGKDDKAAREEEELAYFFS